jgi:uncharacterized protein YwqG
VSEQDRSRINALLGKYKQAGIALHRPYPPDPHNRGFSKFGGKPNLPAEIDWPRGTDPYPQTPQPQSWLRKLTGLFRSKPSGPPLHFLAQIDCSALPPNQAQLPTCGGLFFFGRMDDEAVWDDDPHGGTRVIYIEKLDRATPPRMPPHDTWQVYNHKPPSTTDFDRYGQKRLTTDPVAMQTFPEWPMTFSVFDSYPQDLAAMDEFSDDLGYDEKSAFLEAYETTRIELIEAELLSNIADLGGLPTCHERLDNPLETEAELDLPEHKKGHKPWMYMPAEIASVLPKLAVFPMELAAHIGWHIQKTIQAAQRRSDTSSDQVQALETYFQDAQNWIARLETYGPATQIDDETSAAFLDWIAEMDSKTYLETLKRSPYIQNQKKRGEERVIELPVIELHIPYWRAILHISRLAATNTALYDLLPAVFFSYPKYGAVRGNPLAETHFRRPHQMLGHFQSSQAPFPVESKDVPLLYLYSDHALDFLFWDCGEATFFINADDLRDRNFDEAWATIQG